MAGARAGSSHGDRCGGPSVNEPRDGRRRYKRQWTATFNKAARSQKAQHSPTAMLLRRLFAVTLASWAAPATCSYVASLTPNAQALLNESMSWMDTFYDAAAGYLYGVSAATALRHETRSSAWYAIGLLARNEGDDVANADKILTNIVDAQFKDPAEQWSAAFSCRPLPH